MVKKKKSKLRNKLISGDKCPGSYDEVRNTAEILQEYNPIKADIIPTKI